MPKISVIHYKKLVKFFQYNGFALNRKTGDHFVLTKNGIKRPVIIPAYKEVPVFIIKENLKTAEIDREDYLKYFRIT